MFSVSQLRAEARRCGVKALQTRNHALKTRWTHRAAEISELVRSIEAHQPSRTTHPIRNWK